MKASLPLFILCFFATTYTFGQKLEVGVQLNSGVSCFGGESAASETRLIYYPNYPGPKGITEKSYGSKLSATYGISAQVQQVFSSNFLVGAQAGVESLRSNVNINRVEEYRNNSLRVFEAEGSTERRYDLINVAPYVGRRVNAGAFDVDVTLGTDLGLAFHAEENAKATYANGEEASSKYELSTSKLDVRPRIGAAAYYHSFGLSLSYAHGLTNYMQNYDGANPEVYMRVLRVGLIYKIK
ncbi:outer membrane beta-barrel protein [Pontibacter sp. H249]|uniref:outer membrane beta-barrel protein n=1 Tax=Pontibacter sp. H249 TaxID=3133420 RepID=UPI0030BA42B4